MGADVCISGDEMELGSFLTWTGGDRVEPRRGRVEKVVICFPVEFSALVKFLFRLDPIRLGNSR